jgi:hypothetical protein
MRHLGSYQGKECYEVSRLRDIPTDEEYIYVLGTNGAMYFGGTQVGKLNLNGYKVLEFDLEIYKRKKRKAEEMRKRTEYQVEVPACVADCTSTTVAVGEEMDLCGTDEFFARVALDIDETLKNAGKFNFD